MSREIKFRAWDIDEETWCSRVNWDYDKGFIGIICVKDHDGKYIGEYVTTDIVVEQYTGLKDEDGKEIYEGDIVTLNCSWEEVDPRDCCVITFEDGCFRVGDAFENEAGKYLKEYRLVGNIHENPELLGDEDA